MEVLTHGLDAYEEITSKIKKLVLETITIGARLPS